MIKTGSATILSTAAKLSGDMMADEDVLLSGTFEGSLRTSRTLQVATTGVVRGEVHADNVLVMGHVAGPISAADRIELQPGARVDGDLAAQHVRIHDDVVFNGRCRITGPAAVRRQYLLPAVVQGLGTEASPQALENLERAAEGFLRDFGFEVEVRADRAGKGGHTLRPIFRSSEPVPYARLRERLHDVESTLQELAGVEDQRVRRGSPSLPSEPLQTSGAQTAQALLEAMGSLRNAALMLGPVIVTRLEAPRGPRLVVRVRQDSLPPESVAAAGAPDPSALLLSLQKAQTEVSRDLAATVASRNGAEPVH